MLKNKGQLAEMRAQSIECRVYGMGIFIFYLLFFAFCILPSVSFAQENFVYDSKGKRDPFIPLVGSDGRLIKLETEKVKGALTLEGIIYDESSLSYAVVNGAVVKVGDMVEGNQVLRVEKNKVIFIKEGQMFNLELKEKEEK